MGKQGKPSVVLTKEAPSEDKAKLKAQQQRIFKLEQQLTARELEVEKLRGQVAGLQQDDSPVVKQLKEEARQLRLEVINVKSEALKMQRERDQFKKERDAALVQLAKTAKPAITAAPAAPPAP